MFVVDKETCAVAAGEVEIVTVPVLAASVEMPKLVSVALPKIKQSSDALAVIPFCATAVVPLELVRDADLIAFVLKVVVPPKVADLIASVLNTVVPLNAVPTPIEEPTSAVPYTWLVELFVATVFADAATSAVP